MKTVNAILEGLSRKRIFEGKSGACDISKVVKARGSQELSDDDWDKLEYYIRKNLKMKKNAPGNDIDEFIEVVLYNEGDYNSIKRAIEKYTEPKVSGVNEGRAVDDNERKLDEFLKNNLKGFKKGRFFGEYVGKYWDVSTDSVSIRILGEDSLEFLYDDYAPAGIEKSYQTMLSFLKEAQDELKFIVSVLKKAESEGIMLER